MTQTQRMLMKWLLLVALTALVSTIGVRSYLSPELLFGFANSFTC